MAKDPVCGMEVDPSRLQGSLNPRSDLLLLLEQAAKVLRSDPQIPGKQQGAQGQHGAHHGAPTTPAR
jgi:hypothetical protein